MSAAWKKIGLEFDETNTFKAKPDAKRKNDPYQSIITREVATVGEDDFKEWFKDFITLDDDMFKK